MVTALADARVLCHACVQERILKHAVRTDAPMLFAIAWASVVSWDSSGWLYTGAGVMHSDCPQHQHSTQLYEKGARVPTNAQRLQPTAYYTVLHCAVLCCALLCSAVSCATC
jgi:hypothetical protein